MQAGAVYTPAAPQGLAIDLDVADAQVDADGVDPGSEAILEDAGCQVAEEIAEGVVGGDAVRQQQAQGAQPGFLGAAESGEILEAFGTRQEGAQGDGEDVAQAWVMKRGSRGSWTEAKWWRISRRGVTLIGRLPPGGWWARQGFVSRRIPRRRHKSNQAKVLQSAK